MKINTEEMIEYYTNIVNRCKMQESPSCVSFKYEQKYAYTTEKYTNKTRVVVTQPNNTKKRKLLNRWRSLGGLEEVLPSESRQLLR